MTENRLKHLENPMFTNQLSTDRAIGLIGASLIIRIPPSKSKRQLSAHSFAHTCIILWLHLTLHFEDFVQCRTPWYIMYIT